MLEGVNDSERGFQVPAETVTAEELIAADKQVIDWAHTVGIQAIGAPCRRMRAERRPGGRGIPQGAVQGAAFHAGEARARGVPSDAHCATLPSGSNTTWRATAAS